MAILCVRDERVLTNSADRLGFHFLPGGALSTGEDNLTCAQREWLEETGVPPGPLHLVGVIEKFFGPPEKRQHEIGFYYRLAAPDEVPDEVFAVLDNDPTSGCPFRTSSAPPCTRSPPRRFSTFGRARSNTASTGSKRRR